MRAMAPLTESARCSAERVPCMAGWLVKETSRAARSGPACGALHVTFGCLLRLITVGVDRMRVGLPLCPSLNGCAGGPLPSTALDLPSRLRRVACMFRSAAVSQAWRRAAAKTPRRALGRPRAVTAAETVASTGPSASRCDRSGCRRARRKRRAPPSSRVLSSLSQSTSGRAHWHGPARRVRAALLGCLVRQPARAWCPKQAPTTGHGSVR